MLSLGLDGSSLPTVEYIIKGDFNIVKWFGIRMVVLVVLSLIWRSVLGLVARLLYKCLILIGGGRI